MNMSRHRFWLVSVFVMSVLLGMEGRAESGAGGTNASSRFASRHAKVGKKPYPAGTRAQWIAQGRVLGRAPEGAFHRNKALKGAADNRSYLPPIGDQGSENSCVHWAGTYYCKTANMKRMNPSLNITATSNQCSPRFTYNLSNGGSDGGGYGHEPFEIFMRYGVPSLQQKPIAGGYTILPTVADFVEGLHRRTTNYVWLWEWEPESSQITELKAFLDAGGVAVAGVDADSSFDAWSSGDMPWVGETCTEDDINHMVTVCGYGTGYYLVANSWGTGYGSNGYIVVDSDYFENYFSDVMYPLEGTYTPVTSYAKLQIEHGRRSDIRNLLFSVNGLTVWSNSPLPRNLPAGTGTYDEDTRSGWELAVDLSSVTWSGATVVTACCADRVVGTVAGRITNFTVRFNGTNFVSGSTPVTIPDNNAVGAAASVAFTAGPLAWDNGYTDLGGGWRRLAWFGDYANMGSGWIWHNKHGFLFASASSTPSDIWFFANDMGWLWTGNTTYPYLYRSSPSAWLWYNGSRNPRWFRNMTANTWENWP